MTRDLESTLPRYYLYDDLPVKMELTASGGLRVSVFDPATRSFRADSTYGSRIMRDRDNLAQAVSELEFETRLHQLLNG